MIPNFEEELEKAKGYDLEKLKYFMDTVHKEIHEWITFHNTLAMIYCQKVEQKKSEASRN